MQATLNIEGLAYCTIDIEGSSVPPTSNMLSSIMIMDGFGLGAPILQLVLNDEKESLSDQLAIKDGTRITISMGRDTKNIISRSFRIFGWKRGRGSAGPRIELAAIMDVPKFCAGVFTEAYKMTSSDVMAKIAESCGLDYDGPSSNTDDMMPWINLNMTRLAFSEDVAMRGYVSEESAMARCLTMDKVLRYKNLFEVLGAKATHTFAHNSSGKGVEGKSVPVREARDASASGLSTHFVNYGQKHYAHSLLGEDVEILSVTAPLLGAGLPVNDEVRNGVAERGARVTYSGFDPGTSPSEDANVHRNYEQAYYQNLRFLSLFSERVILMVDECTEVQTFDPVAYILKSNNTGELKQAQDVSSKYIVGGKTILIKDGKRYAEAAFLYRPFITAVGLGAAVGAEAQGSKQNAKASASGPLPESVTSVDAAPTNVSQQLRAAPVKVPAASAAKDALTSFDNFNSAVPAIPSVASNLAPTAASRSLMDNVRNSVSNLSGVSGPLGDSIKAATKIPADTSFFHRVVSVGSDFLRSLTGNFNINRIASDIDYARRNGAGFKQMAIGRVTGAFSDVSGFRINNIVSAATGSRYNAGALVGEVLGGGIHVLDLQQNGVNVGAIDLPFDLPMLDTATGKSTSNFLMSMTGLGLTSENIIVNPNAVASAVNAFANGTDAQTFLTTRGADAYIRTFGNVSPSEANSSLQELSVLSAKVMRQYGTTEYLTDERRTDSLIEYAGKETLFTFGGKGITPLVNSVDRVVDYGEYQNVQTMKQATTWANLYSMGTNVVTNAGAWESPVFPAEAELTNTTAGMSNTLEVPTTRWLAL